MKRKHYNLISVLLWIVALVLLIFYDPFQIEISWSLFFAILLAIIGIIIHFSANRCPYCDKYLSDYLLRPAKYCPQCGSDISDI